MNGETTTGVTTFMIDEKIDTGKILMQEETPVGPDETAGELHDRLMHMGAELVLETVRQLAEGRIEPRSQADLIARGEVLKSAPKIGREDCRIDWERTGAEIHNLIRGLSPYPGAFTYLPRKDRSGIGSERVLFKILSSVFEPGAHTDPPGSIHVEDDRELHVSVRDGFVVIRTIQQEGKRVMEAGDFLRGFNLSSFLPRFS
jgi:methionyl-tRNA formyltransferase